MKYKVFLSGFCYVEADSPALAEEKVVSEEFYYQEFTVDSVLEVDSFVVDFS